MSDGMIGGKHWSDSSAPTGQDWTNLSRRVLIAEATIEEYDKKLKALELLIAALSVSKPSNPTPGSGSRATVPAEK